MQTAHLIISKILTCLPFKRPYDDAARKRGAVLTKNTNLFIYSESENNRKKFIDQILFIHSLKSYQIRGCNIHSLLMHVVQPFKASPPKGKIPPKVGLAKNFNDPRATSSEFRFETNQKG